MSTNAAASKRVLGDALRKVTTGAGAQRRFAFFSENVGYEDWLKFELLYALGRRAHFGRERSDVWATSERAHVDVSIHQEDEPLCDVELKVLTNNKNFAGALRGVKNSVARDFAKLRAKPSRAGIVVVACSRRRYKERVWPHYRDYSMESMRADICLVAKENNARLFFSARVLERPVGRMKDYLHEHELEVLAFVLRSRPTNTGSSAY